MAAQRENCAQRAGGARRRVAGLGTGGEPPEAKARQGAAGGNDDEAEKEERDGGWMGGAETGRNGRRGPVAAGSDGSCGARDEQFAKQS